LGNIESQKSNVDVIYELLKKFDKLYDKMDRNERGEWIKRRQFLFIWAVTTWTK